MPGKSEALNINIMNNMWNSSIINFIIFRVIIFKSGPYAYDSVCVRLRLYLHESYVYGAVYRPVAVPLATSFI